MLKSNKFWFYVLGVVLIASTFAAQFLLRAPAGVATVYLDGVLMAQYDLSSVNEPFDVRFDSDNGYNVVSLEQGRVCISEADCLDGFCVRQGWVSGGSVPIVCLPHRLVITNVGGKADDGLDAVVG